MLHLVEISSKHTGKHLSEGFLILLLVFEVIQLIKTFCKKAHTVHICGATLSDSISAPQTSTYIFVPSFLELQYIFLHFFFLLHGRLILVGMRTKHPFCKSFATKFINRTTSAAWTHFSLSFD